MDLILCSNCDCNITEDADKLSPYLLRVEVPDETGEHKVEKTYQLCKCCAEGVAKLLDENEKMLLNLHGDNCYDILPIPYRCVHSNAASHCN